MLLPPFMPQIVHLHALISSELYARCTTHKTLKHTISIMCYTLVGVRFVKYTSILQGNRTVGDFMYVNEYDSRSLGFNMLKLIKFDIVVRLALLGLAWPDEAREEKNPL